jgi:hypothetical protein
MRRPDLPDFSSPATQALRALYVACPASLIRGAILEMIRLCVLLDEMEDYCESIRNVWREEVSGTLVAMEQSRIFRHRERSRIANSPTHKPKA